MNIKSFYRSIQFTDLKENTEAEQAKKAVKASQEQLDQEAYKMLAQKMSVYNLQTNV